MKYLLCKDISDTQHHKLISTILLPLTTDDGEYYIIENKDDCIKFLKLIHNSYVDRFDEIIKYDEENLIVEYYTTSIVVSPFTKHKVILIPLKNI